MTTANLVDMTLVTLATFHVPAVVCDVIGDFSHIGHGCKCNNVAAAFDVSMNFMTMRKLQSSA